MASDPRLSKPRLQKSYTEEQLDFLRSHLPQFEKRSQSSVRGDAKKYALLQASQFIARFGIPDDYHAFEESESKFREQIYNWFKNTVGRTRRKLEGRPRSSRKANTAKDSTNTNTNAHASTTSAESHWNSASSIPTPASTSYSLPVDSTTQYGGSRSSLNVAISSHGSSSPASGHHPNVTLRDAFLSNTMDSPTLASIIQAYAVSNPSSTPLTAVVQDLFEAILISDAPLPSQVSSRAPYSRDTHSFLRLFLDACSYFPPSLVHAGVSGPLAGPRALQMQIRKNMLWVPKSTLQVYSQQHISSLSDEMQRIAMDRQRRKDHIQWARIHGAALELGMLGMGHDDSDDSGFLYAKERTLSEVMARDSVWEQDEVEWVAGIIVLRAVIRTAMRGDRRKRDEYDELLRTYERRWKDIKDETRQAVVAEVLLGAKDDLLRLDEPHMA